MSSLDIGTITQLLKEGSTKSNPGSKSTTPHERPIQLGRLRYSEQSKPCVRKGCTSPTCIRIDEIALCSTHALYQLNKVHIKNQGLDWVLDECDCKTGHFSMGSMHNEDCVTFARLKELTSGNS